jgi:creatinine amidohydrolase/Fe(II)-dependent formamide hydrolase-like protein
VKSVCQSWLGYDATQIDFVRILKGQGFTLSEIGTHAGLNDKSLMLALDPSLVREDQLSDGSKFGGADGVRPRQAQDSEYWVSMR